MPFFKKYIISLVLFGSLAALGNSEVEKLVRDYKQAMNSRDKEKVKSLVTQDYYQKLNKNNLLERLFKAASPKKEKKFEVEVIESKVVKGAVMAGVKETGSAHKDWYKIKKTEKGFKIQQEIHID